MELCLPINLSWPLSPKVSPCYGKLTSERLKNSARKVNREVRKCQRIDSVHSTWVRSSIWVDQTWIAGLTQVDWVELIRWNFLPSLCVCYLCHLRPDFWLDGSTFVRRGRLTWMVQKLSCLCACFKKEEGLLCCLTCNLTSSESTRISQDGSTPPYSDCVGYRRSNSDQVYWTWMFWYCN